ncbi:DNA metabolism protein [Dysgonomonas sp. 216]|uniref:TIGR03915 family putative DNA repair protein n=1 Tax=Dysgonomonas sp. 216 TaxID=2302934 RepID=UPI0013D7CE69|nr:TIGR03915 family putative DNA repair protein [Dysgonomonas sp. 216]NDW19729.1 DNA metabolism protein [Dysgonomonas sp. 216]
MIAFRYDKTFEGFLTGVFEAYDKKVFPEKFLSESELAPLFAEEVISIETDDNKAYRVWQGLLKKLSKTACQTIWMVWLSEKADVEELLLRYIRKVFAAQKFAETNFGDPDVLEMSQIAKMVGREAEHIRQFTRFQKAADGIFFAPVTAACNALPLSINYFKDRFADQQWIVYDIERKYGFFYDLKTVTEITLDGEGNHLLTGKLDDELMDKDEKLFQEMWKGYFKALTIKERINLKLQRQHMPRRFWKYLTEKQ